MDLQGRSSTAQRIHTNKFHMVDDEPNDHLELKRTLGFGNRGAYGPLWNFGKANLLGAPPASLPGSRSSSNAAPQRVASKLVPRRPPPLLEYSLCMYTLVGRWKCPSRVAVVVRNWNRNEDSKTLQRALQKETDPSIVRVHSFVITFSYAHVARYVGPSHL